MKKLIRMAVLLSFIFGITKKTFSQTITELSFFSPLVSTFDMDYINDHLVISQQYLYTIDVSDPQNPQVAGQTLYPGSYAYQVAAEGNHVYMAMGGNGVFAVYNISNFSMPWLTGSVSIPSTAFLGTGDLAPHGNVVYMAGFDTLYVVDVSDSSSPHVISTQVIQDIGFGGAGAMCIIDSTLFVTTPIALQVFNITDPQNPAFVTSFANTHSSQKGIAADTIGKRVFLPWVNTFSTHTGYDALDISNPASPALLFSDSTTFGGGDFGETAYYNNVLFVSQGGGVNAFDVSPFNHHFVTSFTGQNVPNASVALDIRDSVFYNARGGGFEVLLYSGGFPTVVNDKPEQPFSSLQFLPNPVAATMTELNFSLSSSIADAHVEIRNSLGEDVEVLPHLSFTKGFVRLALSHALSPGMYFVTLINSDQSFTGKVMVE
jgi:hypothetical protein